jgi:hypothetical protein
MTNNLQPNSPLVAVSTQVTLSWSFTLPPSSIRSGKMQLLTIGGICVTGSWYGQLGEYFVAWAPLLKIDHDAFAATIEAYRLSTIKEATN